jgi:hypothetical protein
MIRSRPLFLFTVAALLGMRPVSAADTCFVRAVIGGKAAELKNCALAVYDEKGATIFFSESPIGAEERAAFELNSYPKDTDPSGELSMSSASSGMLQRQWVFELPRDAGELKIEKLAGTLGPGGRLSGRISGGRTSDGLKYSWAADFDLAIPGKQAVAGAGCGD